MKTERHRAAALNKPKIRNMHRLGKGEFESVVDGVIPPSVHDARDYFLMAVREQAPEVLRDLNGEPFECYCRTGLHFDESDHRERLKDLSLYDRIREIQRLRTAHVWNTPEWRTHFEVGEIDYDERLAALQKSIFAWSRKWNLDQLWCRERAVSTLDYWCSSPEGREQLIWGYEPFWETIVAFRRGEHPEFEFRYKTLYPREGHRPDLERRITTAFKEQLKAFLDHAEQLAKEAGMRPTPKKRERLHFAWLACFQVRGMSYQEILKLFYPKEYVAAKEDGSLNEHTKRIRKAVNEVSRLITLPLRSDGISPGRRPSKRVNRNFRPTPP